MTKSNNKDYTMTIEILHIPEEAQVQKPDETDIYALRALHQEAMDKLAAARRAGRGLTWTRLEQGVHEFGDVQEPSSVTTVEVYPNGMGTVLRPNVAPVILGTQENKGLEVMITRNPDTYITDIVRHVPEDQNTPTHPSDFTPKDS